MTSRMARPPLVSCLCVTEDRPAFVPWLGWNYGKQDYERRELVIVDSSRPALELDWGQDVRMLRCAPGTSVAAKRNLAVAAARGEVIAWFDDDDWQHPRRLSLLVAALGDEGVLAGARFGWFVELERGRARPYDGRGVIFNGCGVRRSALGGVRFDEERVRAADTGWLASVRREARAAPRVVPEVLSWWLCHGTNVSNPIARYRFPRALREVEASVGPRGWSGTGVEIERLRRRLGG